MRMQNVLSVSSRLLLQSSRSSNVCRHKNASQLARKSSRNRTSAEDSSTSTIRLFTSSEARNLESMDESGPTGTLFCPDQRPPIGPNLIGASGSIQRTFGPRSNAESFLATGGPELAAHASFDPDYGRAQDWIRHHAVGPAVLSPILIPGLTGALTEAAFPHGVITAQSMQHKRPLIVGVAVAATIEVVSVKEARRLSSLDEDDGSSRSDHKRKHGYDVVLRTVVVRVRDNCIIAEGAHELWIPDYLRM